MYDSILSDTSSWIHTWIRYLRPSNVTIVIEEDAPLVKLVRFWNRWQNQQSPTDAIGYIKVFKRLKFSMDSIPPLPDFQLQFGQ